MRAWMTSPWVALLLTASFAASAPARAQESSEPDAEESVAAEPSTEREAATVAEPASAGATVEVDQASSPSSGASGALGLTTVLAAVATAASLGFWLEREDNVGVCARYAMDEPPTLGCLNTAAIRDQRDVGIGLTIGFGALTIGAAIAWAIVVATTPAPPAETGFTCAPGVLSVACAGRF